MYHLFPSKIRCTILLFAILVFYTCPLYAGTITPYGDNPIDVSVANKYEVADYTFTFIPDTTIPAGGALYITFPTQYTFGLGITSTPVCSVTCTISAYTAVFFFDSAVLNGVSTSVTISSVVNPSQKGGTGSFQLISKINENILDANLIFGVIGIADTIGLLTSTLVSLDSSGVSNAGEVTKYAFSFKVSQIIPAGSYMKFSILDENFGLSAYPSCSAFSVNSKIIQGKLTCQTSGRSIIVNGLTADIPKAQDVGISVSMTNPGFSGTTKGFVIALYRKGTNAIYDRRTGIAGVPITAGKISNVALTPLYSYTLRARNKVMDYTLTFLPKNALPLGSVITIKFPATFVVDQTASQLNLVSYGLDDISEDQRVSMVISNNIITLSIFKAIITPSPIALQLRIKNPDNIGATSPVYIRTYIDSTLITLIDQDITQAYTSIQNLPSPTAHAITTNTLSTALLIPSLEFSMTPSVSIPASGIIKVRVPDGYLVANVYKSACSVKSVTTSGQAYVVAGGCSNIDNLITITLPSTVTFPLGTSCNFMISNVVTTPTYNGTYLFDITSYKSDSITPIESWTDYMIATSVPFPAYSFSSICIGAAKSTVLTISFTTGLPVPAGIIQQSATDLKGFFELIFTGIPLVNLGGVSATVKTYIPCRANSGITPLDQTISCYIYPSSVPTVRVESFEAIAAGTLVSVSFPNILNPSASFQVYMKTIQRYNRIRTEINTVLGTVVVAAAGALTESGTVGSSVYSFSSNTVSTFTNITFNPGTSTNIVGPGTFIIQLPSFDIGWIPVSNTIGCKLDATYYPCTRYNGADWITISLPSGSTFYTGKTIKLENVQVPRYSNASVTGPLLRFIMGSNNQERVYRPQQYFPQASVPKFFQASLLANKKSKGAVNAEYALTFASINEIPQASSIVITFPTGYNLLASYPPVQFSSPDLKDISVNQTVTYTPDILTVTITNFKTIAAMTSFTITVQGIRNPSAMALSSGWKAEINLNGSALISHSNFDQFAFTPALDPGTITFNSIVAFPSNTGAYADYTLDFVPATAIPSGGQVRITFPSGDFSSLPLTADCTVTGGITTYSKCSLSGNTYTLLLDNDYSTSGMLVTISGVPNPAVGATDGFIVKTYYDGLFLDKTDTSDLTGRTVDIVDSASNITIKSLTFDPRNEGEEATYTFVFLPTNTITSTMQILFTFPDVYDELLGNNVGCTINDGLDGTIECTVSHRAVTVSGFSTYTPDADFPISISVYGVVNPNQNINHDTGKFTIATLLPNTQVFKDYNAAAGSFETISAPNWAPLYNISATNLNARLDADYTFNFTNNLGVPSTLSQGAILVDFPSDFSLTSGALSCVSNTASFASKIACNVVRNRVIINGQNQSYVGNSVFVVDGITNPLDEGTAGNIVVKTYDGFNAQILERSYKNLDPFTFAYTFPGPQITVNNDNPIRVERGTETNNLYLTLDFPCALNLVFKPTTPGFSVLPFNIDLSLGDIKTAFRVSVPESFLEGTYYIEWETLNDQDPPVYTPLKKTQVIISSLTNLRVTVPTLYEVPFGGNSLPSYFQVNYGPDVGIEVDLTLGDDYSGITLDRKTVVFREGVTKSPFTIFSSNSSNVTRISKGTISMAIAGINKNVYALSQPSLEFQIIDAESGQPDITELSVTSITMNGARIVIGTSGICTAYYMIALAGTATPKFAEVSNGGPAPYTTTNSTYGTVQIGKENIATVTLDDLVAETPYQVYVYVINRGGNTNDPRTETFTTLNRYNAADFALNFKQSFLNSAERSLAIETVAFLLSLPVSKVQERKYIITISSSRLLEEEQNDQVETGVVPAISGGDVITNPTTDAAYMLIEQESVTLNLQIIAIPESSVYPSPVNLALLLNKKTAALKSSLTYFDTATPITATAFTRYVPGFPTNPSVTGFGSSWTTIQASLNNYGFVFVVLISSANDYGKPSPYQIKHGLTSTNVATFAGSVEISTPYKDFSMNITGLNPLTDYNVYVVGGSAHPGYPDLMTSDSIWILAVKTTAAPATPHLDINGESRLKASYTTMLLAVILALVL